MSEPRADSAAQIAAYAREALASGDEARYRAAIHLVATALRIHESSQFAAYPWQHPHVHPDAGKHGPDCPDDCRNPHIPTCGPRCLTLPRAPIRTHGMWLQLGGRGTGKTEGAARYMDNHARGPACDPRLPGGHRMLIVAPTQGDGAESCFRGPSGLRTVNSGTRLVGSTGGLRVVWPNGAVARVLGAYGPEDVERLRAAGNTCLVWLEEAAAQRHLGDALTHTAMGLRVGDSPHYVASTTPKPRTEIRTLIAHPDTVITKGQTRDATRLDPTVLQSYLARYAGTRQGRQELDAELLDDVEGALWGLTAIDTDRHTGPLPEFDDVVVAVDPPGSHTGPHNAEAGIIVAARAGDHGYVFADLSGKMTPEQWGSTVVEAYHRYGCGVVAAETTYGGDMVVSTIRTLDSTIPVRKMPTKVGKRLRAEPVVSLYEQHRVHHVGLLPALEDQMTTWVPGETTESPDRLDALVHALTYLLVIGGTATTASAAGTRIGQRRQGRDVVDLTAARRPGRIR